MDEIEFKLLDDGYNEDKQILIDRATDEISPDFDQRIQSANDAYIQRLNVIRNSNYTFTDRQQLEQNETEAYEAKEATINDEKGEAINNAISADDQLLQEKIFGKGGREAAENALAEYLQSLEQERLQLEQQQKDEQEAIAETPEAETLEADEPPPATQDHFNADELEFSDEDGGYESFSDEFNEIASEGYNAEAPDQGIEM